MGAPIRPKNRSDSFSLSWSSAWTKRNEARPPLRPLWRDPQSRSSSAADRLAPSERRAAKWYDERPTPAHAPRPAERKVKPRVVVHREPSTIAVAGIAHEIPNDTAEFALGRSVASVAALVLEPLDL